mmetsp:Transcript_28151/g.71400  ORF Transcript_28151/g.71400 Transcript_28151/m.71400 type:complete len:242 (-) Transcript_28151:1120-1845(-)
MYRHQGNNQQRHFYFEDDVDAGVACPARLRNSSPCFQFFQQPPPPPPLLQSPVMSLWAGSNMILRQPCFFSYYLQLPLLLHHSHSKALVPAPSIGSLRLGLRLHRPPVVGHLLLPTAEPPLPVVPRADCSPPVAVPTATSVAVPSGVASTRRSTLPRHWRTPHLPHPLGEDPRFQVDQQKAALQTCCPSSRRFVRFASFVAAAARAGRQTRGDTASSECGPVVRLSQRRRDSSPRRTRALR